MDALEKSLEMTPNQPNPWNMIGLLWLEKKKAEPAKEEEHHKKWQEAYDKADKLRKAILRLEKMGE